MLRYDASGLRDERLDLLRGYAVFAMSVNHLGIGSRFFSPITGGSVFLINAAEVFFFISGLTLGMISRRRDLGQACARCYRRTWQVFAAVLLLAGGGLLLGDETLPEGGIAAYVGMVASLREAPFWSDVLVAYVVYLLVAPAVLALLSARATMTALAAIGVAYLLSQLDPEALAVPVASFRNLAANGPLFLGGIVLGWHREAVFAWWASRRWRVPADAIIVALGVLLLAAYVAGDGRLPGGWWSGEDGPFDLGTRESRMPPVALAVVAVYLRCLWLLVDRGWGVLRPAIGWLAMPLGRAALTGYVAHAFLVSLTWRVLESADAAELAEGRWSGAIIGGAFTAAMLVVVAAAGRVRTWWHAAESRRASGLPVTAGLLVVVFGLGGAVAEPHEGDGGDASLEVLSDAIWDAVGGFDLEDAPLVVEPWVAGGEEGASSLDVEEFAGRIREIVDAEGRGWESAAVALGWVGDVDDEAAEVAGRLEALGVRLTEGGGGWPIRVWRAGGDGDADAETLVLLSVFDAGELDDEQSLETHLELLEAAMTAARERSPRSLIVLMPGVRAP